LSDRKAVKDVTGEASHALERAGPVSQGERIWALDALRGLALFGVLAINLDTEFRVSFYEQFMPPAPGTAADSLTADFLTYFFEFKAILIFSVLFGIGLSIQFERLKARPDRLTLLGRRLGALLLFGLVHITLIWNGDILTEYAIAGFIALPFLFARPTTLLFASAGFFGFYLAMSFIPLPFAFPNGKAMWHHALSARDVYGTGGWFDILRFRVSEIPEIAKFLAYIFPRTLALILLGAWLQRSGALDAIQRHSRQAMFCGLAFCAAGLVMTARDENDLRLFPVGPLSSWIAKSASDVANASAPVVMAAGYVLMIVAISRSPRIRAGLDWAVPVGRMALTNYILQSIVLGLIFYGYGLGQMGKAGPAAGLAIAIAIYATQSAVSRAWLDRYRLGPLEWLWRIMTYQVSQDMRLPARAAS
jgi:uncharacterized protein